MQHSTTSRVPWAIALGGTALLVGASACLGTWYGFQVGAREHLALGFVFGAAALGGELLKPLAVKAAADALGRLNLLRAGACLAVALVCVGYSLASALALSATSRGDLAAERQAASSAARGAVADRKRVQAELDTLKPARPVAELEPLVASARQTCRVEVTLAGGRNTVCTRDAKLMSELGRANRRAELEGKLAGATAVAGAEKAADPLATAVAFYLNAAGWSNRTEADWSVWLFLVPVLFLEIGSAFGGIVVAAYRPAAQPDRTETTRIEAPDQGKPAGPKRTVRPMGKLEAEQFLVTQLALNRELPSQDWLAERCRVNKTTASDWFKDWQRRGLITRARSGKRKVIRPGRKLQAA